MYVYRNRKVKNYNLFQNVHTGVLCTDIYNNDLITGAFKIAKNLCAIKELLCNGYCVMFVAQATLVCVCMCLRLRMRCKPTVVVRPLSPHGRSPHALCCVHVSSPTM